MAIAHNQLENCFQEDEDGETFDCVCCISIDLNIFLRGLFLRGGGGDQNLDPRVGNRDDALIHHAATSSSTAVAGADQGVLESTGLSTLALRRSGLERLG